MAGVIIPSHPQMAVDGGARKSCQLIHAPSCPSRWGSQEDRQVLFLPKVQLVELGIDTDHPIDNGSLSCPRTPGEDKDLVLDSLVNRLFLNRIVANPQIFFNLLNRLVDFLSFK